MTVEQLSSISGLPPSLIRSTERGRVLLNVAQAAALATACRTTADYFLLGRTATDNAPNDEPRCLRVKASAAPMAPHRLTVGEWVTISEAARLTGATKSAWYTRAYHISENARRTVVEARAIRAPVNGEGTPVAWLVHRSLDKRLRLDLDGQVERDRRRSFSCSRRNLDRAKKKARWVVAWRKACDSHRGRARNSIALAHKTVRQAKKAEGAGFKISVRSLQVWWRRYATLCRGGGIAGLKGLFYKGGRKESDA